MNTTTSQNKISSTQAQRLLRDLTVHAMRHIDVAVKAPLARDRARALRKLARALAILEDGKKIA